MNLDKYRALFVDEAADHLMEMSQALVQLEVAAGGEAAEAVDTLFRMTHSIKGMAASLEYDAISTLAHRLEDWLEPVRKEGRVAQSRLALVYDVVRAIEEMVAVVDDTAEPPAPRDDLLARLAELPAREPATPGPSDETTEAPPRPKKRGRQHRARCRARFESAPKRSIAS